MIKRVSHIILALFILITTTGLTVSLHYCGDTVKSVSLDKVARSCCDMEHGCCHDQTIIIKVDNDFSLIAISFDFAQFAVDCPVLINSSAFRSLPGTSLQNVQIIYPPPRIQPDLISLEVFRL